MTEIAVVKGICVIEMIGTETPGEEMCQEIDFETEIHSMIEKGPEIGHETEIGCADVPEVEVVVGSQGVLVSFFE